MPPKIGIDFVRWWLKAAHNGTVCGIRQIGVLGYYYFSVKKIFFVVVIGNMNHKNEDV